MPRAAIALLAFGLALTALGCSGTPSERSRTATPTGSKVPPSATPMSPGPTFATTIPTEATEDPDMPFGLTSTAFQEGGAIPSIHTCDGDDLSPPLAWTGVPDGAASLALIVDDPDAGGFIHWLAFAIDPAAGSLPAGVSGAEGGITEGINSFGNVGYGGPCPPSGTHRYVFRLLALDVNPTFSGPPEPGALNAATAGHILGEATLTATYRRGG